MSSIKPNGTTIAEAAKIPTPLGNYAEQFQQHMQLSGTVSKLGAITPWVVVSVLGCGSKGTIRGTDYPTAYRERRSELAIGGAHPRRTTA